MPYEAEFQALQGAAVPPWLAQLRERGFDSFASRGLPSPKLEDWKYTNLRPLQKLDFAPAPTSAEDVAVDRIPSLMPSGETTHRLVFVNGRLRRDLSHLGALPQGAVIGSLSEIMQREPGRLEAHLGAVDGLEQRPMMALNTALMQDGFVLQLDAGIAIEEPIDLVYIGAAADTPLAYHPRNLLILEPGSAATVIEHHIGQGAAATFTNMASQALVGANARLRHYKMQEETQAAFHLASTQVQLDRNASYDGFLMSMGARLSRNDVQIRLEGEGSECHLNGAYLMRGEQHCDTTTLIEHLVPHTACREMFRGVLDDAARAVFQGRIVVHPQAQKSDGHQLCQTLMLSDKAEIDAKPELEIYADDVKCSHGATAGELDESAMFYLRSRGLPEPRARHLLIEAFLGEAVQQIASEGLCPALLTTVASWLSSAYEDQP